jgi:hypothetical protein
MAANDFGAGRPVIRRQKLIASNLRWQLPSEHLLEKFRTPWQFLRVSRQL